MRAQENPRLTYARFNWMINWCYDITDSSTRVRLESSSERPLWFSKMISSILKMTSGFAEVNSIHVSTDSRGDDAFVYEPVTAQGLHELDYFLQDTQDIRDINITLELLCAQKNPDEFLEEFSIYGSCWIVINNNFSKDNSCDLSEGPVSLRLALGTDIYSPFAFGPQHDNRVLAALNGPRLRSFLHRLQDSLPLTLTEIDAYDYKIRDLIDRHGFKMPDDPVAFEKLLE